MFNPGRRSTTDGPTTRQLLVTSLAACLAEPRRWPSLQPSGAASPGRRRRRAVSSRPGVSGVSILPRPIPTAPSAPLFSLPSPRPQPGAAAEAQLLRVINYEISCAQQDCKKRDWVCDLAISLFSSRSLRFSHTVSDRIHK